MEKAAIRLAQLTVRHQSGSRAVALDRISLTVAPGEQVAVIGPSGAGKTTLLSTLACAHRPHDGEFSLFGIDPWALTVKARHALRARLFLAPQAPPLPPRQRVVTAVLAARLPGMSMWQALASIVKPSDPAAAFEALSRFQLGDKLYARVDRLSGGERQRCGLARLLLSSAELFLVDEPLSALDPALADLALGAILREAAARNATLVCSLHQVDMARSHFARLVGLRGGRIVFDAPTGEVTDAMIEALYANEQPPSASSELHETPDAIAIGACY